MSRHELQRPVDSPFLSFLLLYSTALAPSPVFVRVDPPNGGLLIYCTMQDNCSSCPRQLGGMSGQIVLHGVTTLCIVIWVTPDAKAWKLSHKSMIKGTIERLELQRNPRSILTIQTPAYQPSGSAFLWETTSCPHVCVFTCTCPVRNFILFRFISFQINDRGR